MSKRLIACLLLLSGSAISFTQTPGVGPQGGDQNGNPLSVPMPQQISPQTLGPGSQLPGNAAMPGSLQNCLAQYQTKPGPQSNQSIQEALQACLSNGAGENATVNGNRSEPNPQPQTIPLPPVVHSDFEKFVADAAGYYLPVYGRSLFTGAASTFAPMDGIPVPANYVIGPGDEIQLRVWGLVNSQIELTVDRNGQISMPKVGVLDVAGLQYSQLNDFLRTAFKRLYKDFELNATLGKLRSIQVFVLGNANQPGMYTVGSLSSMVDVLFASGGPSSMGSMRSIQLRRGDRVVTDFDLYDLQQKGDRSHDTQVLPGDVIFIPPVGKQIALIGNVNQPGIYELKGDSSIADSIHGAGGLSNVASTDLAILERIEDRRRRLVDQFTLSGENLHRPMQDGDILRIFPISPKFEGEVTLRGSVETPGRYPWHAGMRVSSLFPDRNLLIPRSHWRQQNLAINSQIGRIELTPGNQDLQIAEEQNAQISGKLPQVKQQTPVDILDDIRQNSTEINWDYAVIQRTDKSDLSLQLIPFNLGKAIDSPGSSDDQVLQSADILTIFSRKDLALPTEKHALYVRVSGEVNAPGVYRIKPGETIRELAQQARGLTQNAYLYGLVLTRESAKDVQRKQLDESIMQMKRDLVARLSRPQGLVQNVSQINTANDEMAMEQNMINQLSAVEPMGRVVLGLRPTAHSAEDLPNFELEDGDTITIPPRLNTVQVVGEVYNANAFRYEARKTIDQYLKDTGGAMHNADRAHIYVIHADGTTVNYDRSLLHANLAKRTLSPGDAIVVPIKLKIPGQFWQNFAPVMSVIGQTAVTGAIIGNYLP
jgi:polysaccharide export outer membrane protein